MMILPTCPGLETRLYAYATIFLFPCVSLSVLKLNIYCMPQRKKTLHIVHIRKTCNIAVIMTHILLEIIAKVFQHTVYCKWKDSTRILNNKFQCKCNCFTVLKTNKQKQVFNLINIYRFLIYFSWNSAQPELKTVLFMNILFISS